MSYTRFTRPAGGLEFVGSARLAATSRDFTVSALAPKDFLIFYFHLFASDEGVAVRPEITFNDDASAIYDWGAGPSGGIDSLGANDTKIELAGPSQLVTDAVFTGSYMTLNVANRRKDGYGTMGLSQSSVAGVDTYTSAGTWKNTTSRISKMRIRIQNAAGLWSFGRILVVGRDI